MHGADGDWAGESFERAYTTGDDRMVMEQGYREKEGVNILTYDDKHNYLKDL